MHNPEPNAPERRKRRPHAPRTVQRVAVRPVDVDELLVKPEQFLAPVKPAPVAASAVRELTVAQAAKLPESTSQLALLANPRFRAFWLSRVVSSAAEGALLYAFLLLVVDQANRAALNSVFVICSIVPALLFGLPAGIAIDVLPRRAMLAGLNLLRFGFVVVLVLNPPALPGIFAATIGIGILQQFYLPAENAALPALTPGGRLPDGQALFNLAGAAAQLLGLVILAPIFLKTAGPEALYAVCAAMFFVAAGLNLMLPAMHEHLAVAAQPKRSLTETLRDGWYVIRSDQVTMRALASDVLIGIGMSSLIVIAPLYLNRILDTPAENTVFVFAPAVVGLVLGLRLAPNVGRRFGQQRTATVALLGFACCVGCFGLIQGAREVINTTLNFPLDKLADLIRIPSPVLLAMLISVPAGLFSSLVSVPARSMLLARTPASRRGQTLATAGLLMGAGALIPTLLAGVAADAFGIERVAIAIGVAIAAGAVLVQTVMRPLPPMPAPATPGPAAG